MLLIEDETLDLIAGGYGGDASQGSISVVTITGSPPPEGSGGLGGFGGWPWNWGGGEGSGGAASTPQSTPEPPRDCTPVHSSPVPANAPKNVDMNTLRNTMLMVADYIKTMDSDIEHGAIVVRSADGTFRVGEVKHGTADHVDMSIYALPGDVVVAYIHSHPDNNIDQTRPSRADFDEAQILRANPVADKAMMLYILDNKSGDVFEYTADTPRNTLKTGPNISDDMSQPCG